MIKKKILAFLDAFYSWFKKPYNIFLQITYKTKLSRDLATFPEFPLSAVWHYEAARLQLIWFYNTIIITALILNIKELNYRPRNLVQTLKSAVVK